MTRLGTYELMSMTYSIFLLNNTISSLLTVGGGGGYWVRGRDVRYIYIPLQDW